MTITAQELAHHRRAGDPLPPLAERARAALADRDLQGALEQMSRRFALGRRIAMSEPGMDELRARGTAIRADNVADLRANLAQLEASLRRNGAHVHRAATASDAVRIITGIARDNGVQRVVKSKSMATEEIDLNDHLEEVGIEVVETDLGEWIVQEARERPSHIIAPAIHKTRPQVTRLFSAIAGRELPDRREDLCAFAQQILREAFLTADMGITGVNFACADTGTLVLVTNEGNGRMCTSLPRVHVALMPVEKVLPRFSDLGTMLPLLTRNATGQKLSSYVTFVTGPRREGETDGPDELHVVFLDGGRTALLGSEYEDMLRCVRCGACLNVCPVYGTIGGHAYGGPYSGPMGAVLTPLLSNMEVGADLPFASSLCGACTEACPVGIPLHSMLIALRARATATPAKRVGFGVWSHLWSRPALYRFSARIARLIGRAPRRARRLPVARSWADGRDVPLPADESFHQWWQRNRNSHG